MKIIKTITHKLIQASLLVVTGFNFSFATEPKAIIESYANPSESHYKKSGNVLAYKNCVGQTIVLKSGDYFSKQNPEIEKSPDVIVVPLEDIVALVGSIDKSGKIDFSPNIFEKYNPIEKKLSVKKTSNGENIILNPSQNKIKNYINLATKGTSEDWQKQFIDHQKESIQGKLDAKDEKRNFLHKKLHKTAPKKTLSEFLTAKSPTLKNAKNAVFCVVSEENHLQNLDQLRHTEFQIHTILNSFYSVLKTCELEKKDLIEKEGKLDVGIKYAKILQLLLPASFALDMQLRSPVYSLFEACNSCKLVPWLTMNRGLNKNFFMFKVLDAQVLKYGKAVLANFHSQTAAEKLQEAIEKTTNSNNYINLLNPVTFNHDKTELMQDVYECYCKLCKNSVYCDTCKSGNCQETSHFKVDCFFCQKGRCNNPNHCKHYNSNGYKCKDRVFFNQTPSDKYSLFREKHFKLRIHPDILTIINEVTNN